MPDPAPPDRPAAERTWEVWSVWREHRSVQMQEIHQSHGSEEEARRDGRGIACLAGARLVEVIRPDGSVSSRWSRTDNRWIDYPPPEPDPWLEDDERRREESYG